LSRHTGNAEEQALRQVRALARKAGRQVPAELWEWYVRKYEPDWYEEAAVEDAWATIQDLFEDPPPVGRPQAPGRHRERSIHKTISVAPPQQWVLHSRRFMEEYRPLQSQALSALGRVTAPGSSSLESSGAPSLPDFIPLNQLEEALHDAARQEASVGEADVLWYPTSGDRIGRYALGIRWGCSRKDVGEDYWAAMKHMNPLFKVKTMARSIVFGTNVHEADAVGFLLSDRPLVLPWIEIKVRAGAVCSATITVGTPMVPQEAVRKAYVRARELMSPGGVDLHGTSEWTRLLVDFVNEMKSEGLDWQDIFVAWNNGIGTNHRYRTVGGMQRSYYVGRKGMVHGEPGPERAFTL